MGLDYVGYHAPDIPQSGPWSTRNDGSGARSVPDVRGFVGHTGRARCRRMRGGGDGRGVADVARARLQHGRVLIAFFYGFPQPSHQHGRAISAKDVAGARRHRGISLVGLGLMFVGFALQAIGVAA